MEYSGQQLAGYLVHVREHQEQPLRGSEGRGERAGDEGAMDRSGRACLRLELPDSQDLAEDILSPLGCPLVGNLPHGGRGCDRIDCRRLAQRIRHMCCCRVAVHRFHFAGHFRTPY